MITGNMISELDGTARVWTLSVLAAPRPGELIEWDEPECGSVPAREGVRGWITGEESTRPGTVIVSVAGEGTRWVTINVLPRTDPAEVQAPEADPRFIAPSHHGSDGRPPASPAAGTDTMLARDVKRGWHIAGVGTIERITRADNDQLAFAGDVGERAFPRYTLVEVTRPAPVMWAADWPYPEFTAAEFAAHYQLAGEIIAARGYYAHELQGYADETGVSICGALKLAAVERAQAADPEASAAQHEITAANVTEELETRLSAVIYTLGLLHSRTGIGDFSDQLAAWELGHYTTGPNPARSDALGLLATAAGIFTHISDTQAPVTAPAVPE